MGKGLIENALKYFFTFFLKLEDDLKEKDLIGTSSNGKDSKVQSSNLITFRLIQLGNYLNCWFKYRCSALF